MQRMLRLYVERFNSHDWDGLRELISADAQLRVADAFDGGLATAPYFRNYAHLSVPWRFAVGQVDGEPVVVALRQRAGVWVHYSFVRLELRGRRISRIVDYSHCHWVAKLAEHVVTTNVS